MKRFLLPAFALLAHAHAAQAAPAVQAAAPAAATSAGSMFQVLFGLLVVLGLLAGAAWLLKRFGAMKPAAGGSVRIVGGVSVGSRERVLVVEVADQWIVVGVAPGRVNGLATMPRQETAAGVAPPSTSPNFSTWLKQTIEKRNGS